jgi:glutamate N-acetyltransferase/amino-acid N-acetyltransferase
MVDMDLRIGGFKAAAVKSGIRGKDRLDLGLIVSERPAAAAGVFTRNLVKAAPVLLDQERLRAAGRAQAILVNSGIANACTGREGMRLARLTSALVADGLGIGEELVQVASTGVIGEALDLACFQKGMPHVVQSLSGDGFADVALAMMTTDSFPKIATRQAFIDGKPVKLVGLAKGAGMIMPNMATMLSFIMTDAKIEQSLLAVMLKKSVNKSFNAITVDGDTSTNDTVLILANGMADAPPVAAEREGAVPNFQNALDELCLDLALMIVCDGEGATKLVTVKVRGAATKSGAEMAARTVANSNLVKTAFFGEDANWGRIIGALGRSGANFDETKVSIAFDDAVMVKNGLGQGTEAEAAASKVLKQDAFTVHIDLGKGEAEAIVYTCDFSLDYVKINADYRT